MIHPAKRRALALIFCALTCLLAGCIVVDDFGKYWDKGVTDICLNDIIIREMDESGSEMQVRSLMVGQHYFLMLREHPQDKGGNLIRYEIKGGEYISYRLNETKREAFQKAYPDSPVVLTQETATIPVLNDDSIALLAKIADDDNFWMENTHERYNPTRRTDCIQSQPE